MQSLVMCLSGLAKEGVRQPGNQSDASSEAHSPNRKRTSQENKEEFKAEVMQEDAGIAKSAKNEHHEFTSRRSQ